MTDRAQPGAQRSIAHNIEIGEVLGQLSDGWIVPSSEPTLSAQRSDLDETQFDEFDASYSATSFDVDIQPGEAYVDGWIAEDAVRTITLASSTDNQTVVIGWNVDATYDSSIHATRDDADEVYIDLESNVPSDDPYIPIWEFDTDSSGVVRARDLRPIGLQIGTEFTATDKTLTFAESGVTLTHNNTKVSNESVILHDGNHTAYSLSGISEVDYTSSVNANSLEVNSDGTVIWMLETDSDSDSKGEIIQYELSTAYDINSVSNTVIHESDFQNPFGFAWNSDGTELNVADESGNGITVYTLSTAYDISSINGSTTYTNSDFPSNTLSIVFDDTGDTLYVGMKSSVREFPLSTSYDVSTAGSPTDTDYSSYLNDDIRQLFWRPSGNDIYISTYGTDIYQISLNTKFDLSTPNSVVNTFSHNNDGLSGANWGPNGHRLFYVDTTNADNFQKAGPTTASSGDVLVEWSSPKDLYSWLQVNFQKTLDGETIRVDVEDENGNVLYSDVRREKNIQQVANSKNVALRAHISRTDTTNTPSIDYLARKFKR